MPHPVAASMAVLERVGLADKALGELSALTTAEIKSLELARAMVSEPELLLLDEPLAGLNEVERARFFETVDKLVAPHTAIVVIEHSVRSLIQYVESVVALDDGRVWMRVLDTARPEAPRTACVDLRQDIAPESVVAFEVGSLP